MMHRLHMPSWLLWIYCPGHASVSGNERADRLASTANITSGLQLSQLEWTCRETGKHSRYHIWSAAWPGRGAQRLEELSEHGQAKASQHWLPEGKRSEERKRLIFHPPKLGTICVQPDKHWHCFESNLRETAERWGRVRMGLSECYNAILGRNWNWNWNKSVHKSPDTWWC